MRIRVYSLPSQPSMSVVLLLFLLSLLNVAQSDDLDIKFKVAFRRSDTIIFDSWTPDNQPCNFIGISCNSDGSVTSIELGNRNLVGVIPLNSLCQLPYLQKLDLGSNFLYNTITEALRNCTYLQYLDLGYNSFSYTTISDLSTLTQFELLSLNSSGISGPFPWSSLANMTNLTFLSVGDNFFDNAPFPLEVFKLQKLFWLYFSNCSLEGTIPKGIRKLIRLIDLELADNNLSGEIPVDIMKLTNLWQLELYYNQLMGKIPPEFGNFSAGLIYFDTSNYNLRFTDTTLTLGR